VEAVAHRCGFGSATMLRHHFRRLRSTAPQDYRRTFGHRPMGANAPGGGAGSGDQPDSGRRTKPRIA
jgi:hypothetical protein